MLLVLVSQGKFLRSLRSMTDPVSYKNVIKITDKPFFFLSYQLSSINIFFFCLSCTRSWSRRFCEGENGCPCWRCDTHHCLHIWPTSSRCYLEQRRLCATFWGKGRDNSHQLIFGHQALHQETLRCLHPNGKECCRRKEEEHHRRSSGYDHVSKNKQKIQKQQISDLFKKQKQKKLSFP